MSEAMMTPPSSPCGSPVRARVAFSPSRANMMESPSKRQCTNAPPPTPCRYNKARSIFGVSTPPTTKLAGVREGAPVRTPSKGRKIGSGAYSEVFKVKSPEGKAVMKEGAFSPISKSAPNGQKCLRPKDATEEAQTYGKPFCLKGVCYQEQDSTVPRGGWLCALTQMVTPLDNMNGEEVQSLWHQIETAIRGAPIGVIVDCKPENMGLVKAGAATPFLKEDGSIGWKRQQEDAVVFIDLNHIDGEGDGNWALLIDEPSEQMLRDFKVEIMRQWMENPEEDCLERRSRVEAMFRSQ